MTARYYRSTREAFATDRHPAVFGPYRRNPLQKWANAALWVASVGLLLALVYAPLIWDTLN